MPFEKADANTTTSGSTTKTVRKVMASAMMMKRTGAGSVRGNAGLRPALQAIDDKDDQERSQQHDDRDRRCIRITKFRKPDDDQERRDLRHVRQVAGDEDH